MSIQLAKTHSPTPTPKRIRPRELTGSAVVYPGAPGEGEALDTTEVVVTRNSRGHYSIVASCPKDNPQSAENPRRETCYKRTQITDPEELQQALTECETHLEGYLDWELVAGRISEFDWVTAAVVATNQDVEVPRLPPTPMANQPSVKRLGKVRVIVEWGDDDHELEISFSEWISILQGESDTFLVPTSYEGGSFTEIWAFDVHAQDELDVSYDDGGQGWYGCLSSIDFIEGPEICGVDLAKVAMESYL